MRFFFFWKNMFLLLVIKSNFFQYLIPIILILPKNGIFKPLADFFNFSSLCGVFLSMIKIAEVVLIFKKDSKLD